jgi:hypothetical protein
MNMNWHDLIERYISGTITEAETEALEQQLKTDADLRDWYLDAVNLDSALELTAESAELALSLPVPPSHRVLTPASSHPFRWLSWRPLTAAAAGIVFGMFCTSMVFGFGLRSVEKVMSLLQESFESGPAPLVTGVPPLLEQWSGDYSEIVMEREGVKPKDGHKMARLMRSDFEGRTGPMPSRQGDLMRVVDVRLFQKEANGGDVVMTLSALFNAMPFKATEHYDGMVTIYALGANTQLSGATEDSVKEDALAFSVGRFPILDRDPATWQPASTRLLLPAGTAFVMLKASVCRMPVGSKNPSSLPESVTFAGHFIDDVRASIRIRDAVANHRTQAVTQVAK